MKDEDKKNLKQLKEEVVGELVELSDSDDIPAEQRFTLMINSAAGTDNVELFKKAHDAAVKIEDSTVKVRSLMELLEEIDLSLGNITIEETPAPEVNQDNESTENQQSEE